MDDIRTYTAFVGTTLVASGPLQNTLPNLKPLFDQDAGTPFLIFEDQTGRQVDFDLRGTTAQVLARAMPVSAPAGPGRPKLGVTAREVSLLPRHWEWLAQQPNGASAALRRLVDQARKCEPGEQQARRAIEAASRFLTAIAGNLPGYEEATRALYARDAGRFEDLIREWPPDIRRHTQRLVQDAFAPSSQAQPQPPATSLAKLPD